MTIQPSGTIFWSRQMLQTLSSSLDLHNFPFEYLYMCGVSPRSSQNLEVLFMSFSYTALDFELVSGACVRSAPERLQQQCRLRSQPRHDLQQPNLYGSAAFIYSVGTLTATNFYLLNTTLRSNEVQPDIRTYFPRRRTPPCVSSSALLG